MTFTELRDIASHEVGNIIKVLPAEIAEQVSNCRISYEEKPGENEALEDSLLGLFEGASLIDDSTPDSMPHIRIFVSNLWEYTEGDEQDFLDEVGTTFLHELGHYLGWDEDDLANHGLE